jgi:hypothetical protein
MKLWFGRKKIPLTAPGPSPWYLRAPWASLGTSQGTWTWGFYDGPKLAGLSYLKTPAQKTVLLLDFHFYVLPLPKDRVLLWHESGREREAGTPSTPARITFLILALNELRPLADLEAVAAEMRAKKERMLFEGGDPVVYEFPSNLTEGTHALAPPPPFLELPELLVLADYGPETGNHFDKMFRAIFAFDFKARRVSVIPQRWFNEGSYDFGYQWITRVQREDKTGQIVGEGIRLGNFRLDQSATQIQEWLHKDVFYHPEHEL